MYDISTAMQIALTPAVTLPVIAALAITIVAQASINARRMKDRLRAQAQRSVALTVTLLDAMTKAHKRDTERQIVQAIELTFDSLKDIGFDKLASGEATFEGVMFGDPRSKTAPSFQRRQSRTVDPLAAFSMHDLMEALSGKPRYRKANLGGGTEEGGIRPDPLKMDNPFEESLKNADEGAGLGVKGPRPYHSTAQSDMDDRFGRRPTDFPSHSPRAG